MSHSATVYSSEKIDRCRPEAYVTYGRLAGEREGSARVGVFFPSKHSVRRNPVRRGEKKQENNLSSLANDSPWAVRLVIYRVLKYTISIQRQ